MDQGDVVACTKVGKRDGTALTILRVILRTVTERVFVSYLMNYPVKVLRILH